MIWTFLANLIGGPIIKGVIDGYKAKLASVDQRDQNATRLAIKDIEADIEAKKHAKEIRLATSGFWEMRLITFAIAFPFVAHLWAVWMDTQFGWYADSCWQQAGQTKCGIKAFPSPFDEWEGAILLSFFGIYTVGKAVQSIGTAIALRRR